MTSGLVRAARRYSWSDFGERGRVLEPERDRRRPDQVVHKAGPAGLLRGEPGQRVLGDLVLGAGLAQPTAQRRHLGHGQAAIVGHDHELAAAELVGQLVDRLLLLRPHFSLSALGHLLSPSRAPLEERRPVASPLHAGWPSRAQPQKAPRTMAGATGRAALPRWDMARSGRRSIRAASAGGD